MTDDIVARAARAAAKELAPEYGPRLEAEVEAAIYSAGEEQPPSQFTDWNAVAQTIVQVATLAWTIYQAHKKPGEKPCAGNRRPQDPGGVPQGDRPDDRRGEDH